MPETKRAQIIFYYDSCEQFGNQLGNDLEQALSPLIQVQSKRILGGASPLLPTLEIVMVFTGTTVVTSILSKIGEDIYNHIKNKISKKRTPEEKPLRLIITTFTDQIVIREYSTVEDYRSASEVINANSQIVADAYEKQRTETDQMKQAKLTYIKNGNEFTSVVSSGFLFEYEYDIKEAKWRLIGIFKTKSK
ncbi:MAG TPA: hypothetical protein VKY19_13705 [Ktedonosporobacter sp.]|nr:hypothetical protein [Ktedonosporobacter sp.]